MRGIALLLSFSVGFLSLSQEILWVRLVSFAQQGRPHAFSIVLGAFLIGIAIGAIAGRRLCRTSPALLRAAAWALFLAAATDLFALYLTSIVLIDTPRRFLSLMLLIALTAGMKGVLFPIVHHLGSDAGGYRIGRSISQIYLGNVIGSSLGPLITGFWLLDRVGVESAFAVIGSLTAALGLLALQYSARPSQKASLAAVALLLVALYSTIRPPGIVIPIAKGWDESAEVRHVIQNKHGIIHVIAADDSRRGDVTYGGNAYDGRVSVDMSVNSNRLDRAYLMAVMHPSPKRALVIGLSTGAWVRAIAGMPGIEQIDVVEINPGYIDLIQRYEEVSPLLADPRVRIHVDDGRRWMRVNQDERYDLIFQNTTWHWRAYSTMLLSAEYLTEAKRHLNEGGVVAMNTTDSLDAFVTAQQGFRYTAHYENFVYMSDRPLTKRLDAESVLRNCRIGDKPAFGDSLWAADGIGTRLAREPIESGEEFVLRSKATVAPQVITDMNLIPEFKHGRASPFAWLQPVLPRSPNVDLAK